MTTKQFYKRQPTASNAVHKSVYRYHASTDFWYVEKALPNAESTSPDAGKYSRSWAAKGRDICRADAIGSICEVTNASVITASLSPHPSVWASVSKSLPQHSSDPCSKRKDKAALPVSFSISCFRVATAAVLGNLTIVRTLAVNADTTLIVTCDASRCRATSTAEVCASDGTTNCAFGDRGDD